MTGTQRSKTIKSDAGTSHRYELTVHMAGEGAEMLPTVLRFVGRAIGPLMDVVGKNAQNFTENDEIMSMDVKGVEDMKAVFRKASQGGFELDLDGERLEKMVLNVAEEIVASGNVEFWKKLLKHAVRYDENGQNGVKVLDKFDNIYAANYGELIRAVWFSLEANFGPCLRASLGKAG